MTKGIQRICPECRMGAHDHCACECDVCAHWHDHVLLAKLDEVARERDTIRDAYKTWKSEIAPLIARVERAEEKLAKVTAALREMRTTYVENQHAQEWARFLETALQGCGLCGQEIDPRFRHECPAHYVNFSGDKLAPGVEK